MARKHSKRGVVKQPVEKRLLSPEKRERRVREVPAETLGAIPVAQDDRTMKYFLVEHVVTQPARYETGAAVGPTRRRGEKNDPAKMVPKGSGGSKPRSKRG